MNPRLEQLSDTALVALIGRAEASALAEAYNRHAGAVYGVGRRMLGDARIAEELVQEVFLRLWNEPARFDPDRGTLRRYLLVDAHGRAVDIVRADAARRQREERDARRDPARSPDSDLDIGDLVVSAKVRTALESLPVEQRRVIEVAYFGGYTYQEVATRLQLPIGTVKSRIRSGLRRLHDELVGAGLELAGAVEPASVVSGA